MSQYVSLQWEMFCYAHSFNGDISTWQTSKNEYFQGMFYDAKGKHELNYFDMLCLVWQCDTLTNC